MSDSWDRLLHPAMERESIQAAKEKADEDAIAVFAMNAKQLLLAAPLGEKGVLAIDPGFRTGCKVVCLNKNGDLLQHGTIYPHEPKKDESGAARMIRKWLDETGITVMAIGNGTAGRETADFIQNLNIPGLEVYMVNEAGASIYSASEVAAEEFPELDLTFRGAVSIGRRLQDPLAELVKIDPKNIGVGQYQHDVNQTLLRKRLDAVVESAVNSVGVNLNTASRHLLAYVSGIGPQTARNITEFRSTHGPFTSRKQLMEIPRLGTKVFEQCAGFLRIRESENPLDNSAVHPERYPLVQNMARDLGIALKDLSGNEQHISRIKPERYVQEDTQLGLLTIMDILGELRKPGLDPRGEAKAMAFDAAIRSIEQVEAGMELQGIVSNITDFGAFVDIGVKQDGLVHISQIADRFIKHPSEVLKLGQEVRVRVLDVDLARRRIQLTMKFR
ncbi:MAG: helix-hairpin-helix domain-containing protein, partial [Bacteroidetes bacterium]|nr:helix-hairpin-helix domain-containing protein [Bacteroidota bacterium]